MAAYPGTLPVTVIYVVNTDGTCIEIASTSEPYHWWEPRSTADMQYVMEALAAKEPEPPPKPNYLPAWRKPYPPPHRLFPVPADHTRSNPHIARPRLNPQLLARPPPVSGRSAMPWRS